MFGGEQPMIGTALNPVNFVSTYFNFALNPDGTIQTDVVKDVVKSPTETSETKETQEVTEEKGVVNSKIEEIEKQCEGSAGSGLTQNPTDLDVNELLGYF
jgi:hypothetical protein